MLTERVRRLLRREYGLDVMRPMMESALRRTMRRLGENDLDHFAALVLAGGAAREALLEDVVVPESWFFRDPEAFAVAVEAVRRFQEPLRPVRILSLPCAAGEEPYSLAIALHEAGVPPDAWHIDAVDISTSAIARAEHAVYSDHAFRGRDLGFRDRYFTPTAEGYALHDALRRNIAFRVGNLFALQAESRPYDLIFCRNLLIYFDEAGQAAAAARLRDMLRVDGLLFAGYAEVASLCRHGFAAYPAPRAFALQRAEAQERKPHPVLALPQRVRTRRPAPPMREPARARGRPAPVVSSESLLDEARRLADAGRIEESRQHFVRYLQAVPDSAEAYFMLGLLHEQRHDAGEAEACLRRAVYLDPGHYEALCHLALLAEGRGDRRDAALFRRRAARVRAQDEQAGGGSA